MHNQRKNNLAISANAIELGSRIMERVAGNAVADSIGGVELKKTIKQTLAAKLQARGAKYAGGK